MKIKIKNKNEGFTLMETLVAVFIFGVIMTGTTLMLRDIFLRNRTDTLSMNNVDSSRRVLNNFVNEIRNASNGSNGAYPINDTSENQFIFFSSAPENNGIISRVRYYISGNTLYRGITNPSGNPLSYNLADEEVKIMVNDLSLGGNPLFTYYDGDYNGNTSPLVQPVNVTDTKFVRMNLIVLKKTTDTSTNTFSMSAGGTFRNLKTNLGN
jgi:prepilin-type N-terminal cleavage/methylation domain-containing protein